MGTASAPVSISAVRDLTADRAGAWCAVVHASLAADLPAEALPGPARRRARLPRSGDTGRPLVWLASTPEGEAAAVAGVWLPLRPGHRAAAELYVHPEHRRRGTGTRLLDTVSAAARSAGCGALAATVPACTPGDVFCLRHGFTREHVSVHLLLPLGDVHRAWLDELIAAGRPGYRLAGWHGRAPAGVAAALAAAKAELDRPLPQATADAVAARGERLLTVAALRGDAVAGWTELAVPDSATRAAQHDTTVVPAHRGRGLGLWMKAEMLRRVHDAYPAVTEIESENADGDTHLLAVNEQLGFRPYRRSHAYRLALTGA